MSPKPSPFAVPFTFVFRCPLEMFDPGTPLRCVCIQSTRGKTARMFFLVHEALPSPLHRLFHHKLHTQSWKCGLQCHAVSSIYGGDGRLVHLCEECAMCPGEGCDKVRDNVGRLCDRCRLDAPLAYAWHRVGYDGDICEAVDVYQARPRTQHRVSFGAIVRGERRRLKGAEVPHRRLPQRQLSWADVGDVVAANPQLAKLALAKAGVGINPPPVDVHVFLACHSWLAAVQDAQGGLWAVKAYGAGHDIAYNEATKGPAGACLCVCERWSAGSLDGAQPAHGGGLGKVGGVEAVGRR